jgi:glycosyltransferase involved in cell wall biosynthesis
MSRPWCSIVIPTYNYAAFVGRAIDSALSSAGPPREVIVVDDGSTDRTANVLARYSGRIHAIAQRNLGVSAARNRAIASARGEYVICLDADDELLPDALRTFHDAAQQAPHAGIVFGAYATIDERGRSHPSPPPPAMSDRLTNFRRYLCKEFSIGNGRAAIRRELFERIQFPVGVTHGEDLVVFGQILALADAVSIPRAVAVSYEHAGRARHDLERFLKNGTAPVDALFRADLLGPEAMALRPMFAALWQAELARAAFKLGDARRARALFHQAFACHWPTLVRGRHFGRYLRTYLPQRRAA